MDVILHLACNVFHKTGNVSIRSTFIGINQCIFIRTTIVVRICRLLLSLVFHSQSHSSYQFLSSKEEQQAYLTSTTPLCFYSLGVA